jgi:nitric oxide reductase NorD protein
VSPGPSDPGKPVTRRFSGGKALLGSAWRNLVELPLLRAGAKAGPGARILSLDGEVFRIWARHAAALRSALGAEAAQYYGELVRMGVEADRKLGFQVAITVADQLARLGAVDRKRYFDALEWTIRERSDSAAAVAASLAGLLGALDDASLKQFLARGIDLVSSSPLQAEGFLRAQSEAAKVAISELRKGTSLRSVARILSLYARAHSGEDVRVLPILTEEATAANGSTAGRTAWDTRVAFTDGHDLYLPDRIDVFGDQRDFALYRCMTARAAGFLEFGTFDLRLDGMWGTWPAHREGELEVERLIRSFPNQTLAADLFLLLEGHRIEARMHASYPGIARDYDSLRADLRGERPVLSDLAPVEQVLELVARTSWRIAPDEGAEGTLGRPEQAVRDVAGRVTSLLSRLISDDATVQDSARALSQAYREVEGLFLSSEAGRGPDDATGSGAARGRASKTPARRRSAESGDAFQSEDGKRWSGLERLIPDRLAGLLRPELRLPEARRLDEEAWRQVQDDAVERGPGSFTKTRQALRERRSKADYEEMDAWLEAHPGPSGGQVERPRSRAGQPPALPPALTEGVDPILGKSAGSFVYHEWDYTIADWRPRWVCVREMRLATGSRAFADDVASRHRALLDALRRQFEALRPEEMRLVRSVADGDVLDLDRVIEAITERRAGKSPSERLYARHERSSRDVAAAFLLDMSSSTNEMVTGRGQRVIEVEKEALVLIAEALDAIGDAFAIWGFSGYGRDQVAFYVAKDFEEAYDQRAKERIGRISWKMENRDGAAIRHATAKLLSRSARLRLLILLSDGKPLDCGCERYFDRYAQEDTRVALMEARKAGVHAFCITVDPEGAGYLADMYGRYGYTVIDKVSALPGRLPRIYRRITR